MLRIAVFLMLVVAVYSGPSFLDRLRKRDDEDCIPLGPGYGEKYECRGLPTEKCCGNSVCFWEDGYSMATPGYCVTCVREGQRCQVDKQCCDHETKSYCRKGGLLHTDGVCAKKLGTGEECYLNDDCINGDCEGFFDRKCN